MPQPLTSIQAPGPDSREPRDPQKHTNLDSGASAPTSKSAPVGPHYLLI